MRPPTSRRSTLDGVINALVFRPLSVIFGVVVARKVGNRAFDATWQRRYGTEAPTATTHQATWGQVLGAAALRGTIMGVSAAAFNRVAAKSVHYATGFWPGEEQPPPAKHLEPKR